MHEKFGKFKKYSYIIYMFNGNFKSIIELIERFPTEQSCIDYLELMRWDGKIISPFDENSKVYKCKKNRYKCKNTGKYFNVRTGTLFSDSKVKFKKWFMAIWLCTSRKKGIASLQLAKDINVTQKTAWFMLQRIRNCYGQEFNHHLSVEVEIDETYIGGKNKNRHSKKKVPNSQGRSSKDKTPVLGMIQRGGNVSAKVVENVQSATLIPQIQKAVASGTTVYTDEWRAYGGLYKHYDHSYVKHNSGEYVSGKIHTNSIEGFWSLLKRSVMGTYHFVSRKHLQKYVDELTFKFNTRQDSDGVRFNNALVNIEHELKYKTLIKK